MKAPDFEYLRVTSVEQAITELAARGDSAQILAGGQSLMAMLNLRLAAPGCLIDISRVPGLGNIQQTGNAIRIGAMVTHRQLQDSALVAQSIPLLAQAVPHVAHLAIRNSGTIGGSLALADPAAEYPAVAVALKAIIQLQGPAGVRDVPAEQFFEGFYRTARRPDEILVSISFPVQAANERSHFSELARRRGDYAMVGLAAQFQMSGEKIGGARLAYLAAGEKPVLATAAMSALAGRSPDDQTIKDAQLALANDLDPSGDLQADPATKKHLARVLLARCLQQLRTAA